MAGFVIQANGTMEFEDGLLIGRDVVRASKPVVTLLKSEFLGEDFSVNYIVKPTKSGGAMAPLLTTALIGNHLKA